MGPYGGKTNRNTTVAGLRTIADKCKNSVMELTKFYKN